MGTKITVEEWVLVTTLLLLAKFAVGSAGPRFLSRRRIIVPMVQLLHMLNHYSVTYTLGLMTPSSDAKHRVGAKVEDFFQVWAVLIVTMQDSIRIGRPYKPTKMTLVDLLSTLWAANQLRVDTELRLKVPIWLIWSIHASRVICFFVSSKRAEDASLDNMKLVSDYMMTLPSQLTDGDPNPATMHGYRYIVDGEEKQELECVKPPDFTFQMKGPGQKGVPLLTLQEVWQNAEEEKKDRLLSKDMDKDSRFKDVCLSFALYKLIRRRFYDFPIAEAAHPARAARLVAGAILEEGECYKRALRITEVELSFLHDSLYSKHAAVFSGGFPWVRLALSLLMTTAALYLAYAVRSIPSTGVVVTGEKQKRVTIANGVPITFLVIAIVVCRELAEVGVYVMSQWSKVRIICHYIRQKEGSWQRLLLEKLARVMFIFIWRGQWNQQIRQDNLLMLVSRNRRQLPIPWPWVPPREVKLETEVKEAVFQSLKSLINDIPSALENHSSQGPPEEKMNNLLASYHKKEFADSSSPSPPLIRETDFGLDREGESETYKILLWHIATSLCQIKAIQGLEEKKQASMDLYTLPKVSGGDLSDMWRHYMTAVSLSNYCAYLVTQGLVPDNGLVSEMVLGAMRDEVSSKLAGCNTMKQIQSGVEKAAGADEEKKTILCVGYNLSKSLMSEYEDMDDKLWGSLANFWTGYLLHLSASTRAAKHQTHLQGQGEFTTHLWVMLSHAGFLGKTNHGEQMLDPVDCNDAF